MLEMVMSVGGTRGRDSGTFEIYENVRDVLATLLLDDVAVYVGFNDFVFCRNGRHGA